LFPIFVRFFKKIPPAAVPERTLMRARIERVDSQRKVVFGTSIEPFGAYSDSFESLGSAPPAPLTKNCPVLATHGTTGIEASQAHHFALAGDAILTKTG
jgi:hypothetical protein